MAFTSGSAATPSVLLNALNTFLLANGWTKIRGDIDLNVASPKAARYWRVVVLETVSTNSNSRALRKLNFRTTVGGANVSTVAANFTIDNLASGTAANLISGSADVVTSSIGSNRSWKIQYDFGSATIVREIEMQSTTSTALTPRAFIVQWSNDNETWTTMWESTGLSWTSSEVKLFSFPDTYRFNEHPSDTQPSRAGGAEDYPLDTNWEGSQWRHFSEEYFIWQGPGYDASRRVYIHVRAHRNPGSLTSHLEFQYSTGYNVAIRGFGMQVGSGGTSVFHIFTSNSVNYWFYINDLRLVVVTQSSVSDYTSSYIGFTEAFGHPDFYPFPLCMIASSPNRNQLIASSENGLGSIVDPGFGAVRAKKLDGLDYIGGNRVFVGNEEALISGSSASEITVWPLHHGGAYNNATWPGNKGSGIASGLANRRLFDYLLPTQQNDLPIFPAMIMDKTSGNLGILSGVYAIPGGGLLAAQQAIVISGITYRVFPNRSRRNGSSWFAVKEA